VSAPQFGLLLAERQAPGSAGQPLNASGLDAAGSRDKDAVDLISGFRALITDRSSLLPLPEALVSSVLTGPSEGTLKVQGDLPDWLRGRLIRAGAAVFELGPWAAAHWADGLGMLVRFDIRPGEPIRWRQQLIDSEFARQVRSGGSPLATFGTPSQRSWLDRLRHPVPRTTDNANVHIRPAGRHWVAMTETDRHLLIDPATLQTAGELRFDDALPLDLYMGAHPQRDGPGGDLVNFGLAYGPRPKLIVFRQRNASPRRESIGQLPLRAVPYVHSFALTPGKVILVLPPFELEPLRLLGSSRPVGDHFRWRPERGTRIVLMDRATGRWTEHRGDAFFLFHTVNAFEAADGTVTLDLLAYPDASVMAQAMRMDSIRRRGLPVIDSHLHRIRLQAGRDSFRVESIAPQCAFEFPAIHPGLAAGRRHRQVWGTDFERILKIDTDEGTVSRSAAPGLTLGEPVFVGRPGSSREDDGVLLTVASGNARGHSELIVWDAATLALLARGIAATSIPLGFHGSFEAT